MEKDKVFISYRRDDSAVMCGRIHGQLAAEFGRPAIFMDVYTIPPGQDFKTYITAYLQQCAVQLVIIGQRWLTVADKYGRRRLDDPDDTLRLEVQTALELGILVIPILVEGAKLPPEEGLPGSLKALARLNALPVRVDPDFGRDLERVSDAIKGRIKPRFTSSVISVTDRDRGDGHCRCCERKYRPQVQSSDADLTEVRKAELNTVAMANVEQGKAPFAEVSVRTAAELRWILASQKWSGSLILSDSVRPNLTGVDLSGADLRAVDLNGASLQGASMGRANLAGASLAGANLRDANLGQVRLNGADLGHADLTGVNLSGANLTNANLSEASLSGADLSDTDLSGILATRASFEGAVLTRARLSRALMGQTNFSNSILIASRFEDANLYQVNLSGADLRQAMFTAGTNLGEIVLNTHTSLADVVWNGVALAQIDWSQIRRVGDETQARSRKSNTGQRKSRQERLMEYGAAARAYRGLSMALRSQGLGESAARFRLQEHQMERAALILEARYSAWYFSWALAITSGYGERLNRLLMTYVTTVCTFALLFYSLSYFTAVPGLHLSVYEALILSITSFHGRGLVPANLAIGDPISVIAAVEAIMGLFIEMMFIAVFTRRFMAT